MNSKTELRLSPEKRVELLATLAAGLLASGHYTQLVPVDVPVVEPGESANEPQLLAFSYEDDDDKKKYCFHVLSDANFLLKRIEDSLAES